MKPLPSGLEVEAIPRVHQTRYGSVVGYQIYFDEFSRENLDSMLSPVLNTGTSPFFESSVIADLVQAGYHKNAEFFGVFSWKLKLKFGLNFKSMLYTMEEDRFSSDIYSCSFAETSRSVWTQDMNPDSGNAHLRKIGSLLFERMGYALDLDTFDTPQIHMNAFFARSSLYEEFVYDFLLPALKILENPDEELKTLLDRHTFYESSNHHPRIIDRLKKIFGASRFKFHPFVAERLFPTWVALRIPIRRPKIKEFDIYMPPMGILIMGE